MIRPRSIAYHAGHGSSDSGTLAALLVRAVTIWRHTSPAISSAVQSRAALPCPALSFRWFEGVLKSPISTESTETKPSRLRIGFFSHKPCWLIDDSAHSVLE